MLAIFPDVCAGVREDGQHAEALDGRREALSQLSDLATEILRDAGHNPSLDTLRRITTTLEALSSFASVSDSPTPGRLTRTSIRPALIHPVPSFPAPPKRSARRTRRR